MNRRRSSSPSQGRTARNALVVGFAALALACSMFVIAAAPAGARAAVGRSVHGGPKDGGWPPARARFLMGTRLSIEIDGPVPAGALDAAFDEVARLESILSN